MNNQIVDLFVKLVCAFAGVIITGYVIPWIKGKMQNDKYADLITLCRMFVQSAEKIYTPDQWQEKKIYVFQLIENKAESIGVDISTEELNAIVEGLVYEVKK